MGLRLADSICSWDDQAELTCTIMLCMQDFRPRDRRTWITLTTSFITAMCLAVPTGYRGPLLHLNSGAVDSLW